MTLNERTVHITVQDGDLNKGSSGECETFSSPCLASASEFQCTDCELYGLESSTPCWIKYGRYNKNTEKKVQKSPENLCILPLSLLPSPSFLCFFLYLFSDSVSTSAAPRSPSYKIRFQFIIHNLILCPVWTFSYLYRQCTKFSTYNYDTYTLKLRDLHFLPRHFPSAFVIF